MENKEIVFLLNFKITKFPTFGFNDQPDQLNDPDYYITNFLGFYEIFVYPWPFLSATP